MDKKLFAELMEGVQQTLDHASGKEVKGVREVMKDVKTTKSVSKESIANLRKTAKLY
ncbi:MAG: hypothetical protein ACT4O9_11420 [Blastocatellia bacterium]